MPLIHPVDLSRLLKETNIKETNSQNLQLDIFRGDLEHEEAPGNKWHKLQHHLKAAKQQGAKAIATFGGPFSNHLHAFSSTLKGSGLKTLAVVRGELQPQLNTTLNAVIANGVELWPSSRRDYKLAMDAEVVRTINRLYENVYWIPEGGGGELGALGCMEWAENIHRLDSQYDAWVVSSGTGTTAAGLLAYEATPTLHVISALKGAEAQKVEILKLAEEIAQKNYFHRESVEGSIINKLADKLFFYSDKHHGGYAKHSNELTEFMKEYAEDNFYAPLDPVYTCKSMYFIISAMKQGVWPYSRTLFIHTGGIQGWGGYSNDKNPFLSA
ncbi:cysteine desulfhydrase [Marinomonas sp. C2222]|uniref:Cysteine desulfhydrase n=1 Tax=Marinomonas sargassi TaxID=2984494 RepID=A0ABT2YS86_9GAMM|nr:pyridoxal-phosphate dependent enzyme [Marinomonas sargassi]MCV2402746.1 cysteine desulfhydrase [Marinomonas sargassi]